MRRGDLDDLDGLRQAAAEADGVIHLAFKHEAMRAGDFMGAVGSDLAAIQAMGETLIGTDKPFVTTSGTLMLAMAGITCRPGTEDDQSEGGPRVDAANYTIALAHEGVRSSVIRLAPKVAPHYLGFLAAFAGFDNPTSNNKTRELLGWEPTHPSWVEDVEEGHCFSYPQIAKSS